MLGQTGECHHGQDNRKATTICRPHDEDPIWGDMLAAISGIGMWPPRPQRRLPTNMPRHQQSGRGPDSSEPVLKGVAEQPVRGLLGRKLSVGAKNFAL